MSSGQRRVDDLTFSRLRLQISKSIAKITSALTRRLPRKSSTARRLKAYIRLLQAHRITNGSHPPIIVSFYDSMNHKKFRIKILSFFSSLWRESERYVVFSSQEWKKKKGKSILGALRASNWLFMVVVSSILHSQPKSTVGTPAYIAPGILLRREYDGKVCGSETNSFDLNLSPECRHLISRILVADPATFQEPEQPMQSLDNIMQIISEATIPDVRSLYGFLLNLRLMLIVAEK
ncbi:hypothetical protein YC2023_110137 [Brassica napus]